MTAPHTIDPNAFLMGGGGAPSARFEVPGDTITGVIEDMKVTQQTNFTTQEPEVWPNGDPKNQLVITLGQTGQFDPTRDDEDGRRRVYVKGRSLTDAVRNAVQAVGAKGLDLGGRLTVQYTGDGVAEKRGINPPKLYAAAYQAPNPSGEFLQTQVTPAGGFTAPVTPILPTGIPGTAGYQPAAPYMNGGGHIAPAAAPAYPVAAPVATVPPVQQLMQPPAQVPAAVPPVTGPTPEQLAALAALSPEQRQALGL